MAEDKQLTCVECKAEFTFTAAEQDLHVELGYKNEPKRCLSCREARKQSGRGGPREIHEAVCADCGGVAKVPFKPTGEKPVYCSNCFQAHRSGPGGGGRGRQRKMHEVVCSDCGGTAQVPFKPTGEKPVYCSNCYSAHRSQ